MSATCIDAMRVAARETSAFRPSQAEVDAAYEDLATARKADTRLAAVHDVGGVVDAIEVDSSDAKAQAAWKAGRLSTGTPEVDDVLQQAGAIAITNGYAVQFATPVNIYRIVSTLSALDDFVAIAIPGVDGGHIVRAPPGTVRFTYEWGDCLLGCTARHYWLVVAEGPKPVLLDEGGDDLPPHWR